MSTEKDNRLVWDRGAPGHYEAWYCTFNHLPSRTGFWIRYTLDAPQSEHGEPYCQLWFAFFDSQNPDRNFGINRKLPISALDYTEDPFRLDLAGSVLQHGGLQGSLAGDAHEVSWDLGFKPSSFTHKHLPEVVYNTAFADTRVLSPNPMVYLTGRVTVDGQAYDFDGQPGGQTHIWGRKHAHAHAWSHCSAFREDGTACLETLSVRLKRLGLVTPTLTFISLYLGSEVYHFRGFRKLPLTRGSWETGLYKFRGVGNRIKVEGELRCRPEDLIQAQYSDPDGQPSFCHHTEVAEASVTVWVRRSLGSPFKSVVRLTSHGAAHFEYLARSPDGHVTRRHVTVP